jgi:cytochrome c peroxidase
MLDVVFLFVRVRLALVACVACLLVACGGGGETGGTTPSGGSGSNPSPPPTQNPPPQNHVPVVAQANALQVAVQGHAFSYDATQGGQTFSDPDGDALTFNITLRHVYQAGGGSAPVNGLHVEGTRIVGTPEEAVVVVAMVTAMDKSGESANNEFSIRVDPNKPPAVAAANDDRLTTVGSALDIESTGGGSVFADPEGDPLTYEVTLRGDPRGLSVTGTHIKGALTSIGAVEVTITAKDPMGAVASDVFLIAAPAPEPGAPTLPQTSYVYRNDALPLPATLRPYPQSSAPPSSDTSPADNITTDAGATLGRVLFYDKRLSITNTVACGSCHIQSHGFAHDQALNSGAIGILLKRNTMGLTNVRYNNTHAWFSDMRVDELTALVLQPLQNPEELGSSLPLVEAKLRATSFFPPLFEAAFGSRDITSDRIARAIAQFLQSLISYRAKIDLAVNPMDFGVVADPASVLTAQEMRGLEIFRGGAGIQCTLCHDDREHINVWHANNGIDAVPTDPGTQVLALQRNGSIGVFRAASLRNIAASGPYMHDGRFATLREVIDHYDHGIQDSQNLDAILRRVDGQPRRMNLSEQDKDALEAFLRTLTDDAFLTDPKFSDPFP